MLVEGMMSVTVGCSPRIVLYPLVTSVVYAVGCLIFRTAEDSSKVTNRRRPTNLRKPFI